MLYDTKWQKYNYAGVYLPSFVAWLSTRPRDEYYCFYDSGNCAVAQYLKDIGNPYYRVEFLGPGDGDWLCRLVHGETITPQWTFGALHDRARALMDGTND